MREEERELIEAASRGDAAKVRALVDADPGLVHAAGEHRKTALHWAAESDHVETARVLVDAGADLEARTSWGATAFDWAATMGSVGVADLLLERGASGLTLLTAAALGKEVVVRRALGTDLAEHRRRDAPAEPSEHWPPASAHVRGDVLSDAVNAAARNGHTAVVSLLLQRGADVDAKGVFGASALQWAAINGHAGTVELLLERGADPTFVDPRFAATAEGWAVEGGHAAIAELLRSRRRSDSGNGSGRRQ